MAKHSYSNNMSLHIESCKVAVNWYESSSLNQVTCLSESQKKVKK